MGLRVRYYCHAGLPTGFGRCALEYALALTRHTDVDLDLRLIPSTSVDAFLAGRGAELRSSLTNHLDPDVVMVHTLPRDCSKVLDIERISTSTPVVAYTTWETHTMAEEVAADLEASFNRVLTPSLMSAQAISRGTGDCPGAQDRLAGAPEGCHDWLAVVPHCFDETAWPWPHNQEFAQRLNRSPSDHYAFYYVGAWNDRKNVDGLVRAFAYCVAQKVEPFRACLILQCPKADQRRYLRAAAATGIDLSHHVDFRSREISDDEVWKLHRRADCFVTASRGEAWNLGAFEAMLTHAHVIAPKGHGSDEFLAGTSADLVQTSLEPAFQDAVVQEQQGDRRCAIAVSGPQGLTSRQCWWEPSIRDLARCMADASRHRTLRLTIDYDVAARYGHAAVAQTLLRELEIAHG